MDLVLAARVRALGVVICIRLAHGLATIRPLRPVAPRKVRHARHGVDGKEGNVRWGEQNVHCTAACSRVLERRGEKQDGKKEGERRKKGREKGREERWEERGGNLPAYSFGFAMCLKPSQPACRLATSHGRVSMSS